MAKKKYACIALFTGLVCFGGILYYLLGTNSNKDIPTRLIGFNEIDKSPAFTSCLQLLLIQKKLWKEILKSERTEDRDILEGFIELFNATASKDVNACDASKLHDIIQKNGFSKTYIHKIPENIMKFDDMWSKSSGKLKSFLKDPKKYLDVKIKCPGMCNKCKKENKNSDWTYKYYNYSIDRSSTVPIHNLEYVGKPFYNCKECNISEDFKNLKYKLPSYQVKELYNSKGIKPDITYKIKDGTYDILAFGLVENDYFCACIKRENQWYKCKDDKITKITNKDIKTLLDDEKKVPIGIYELREEKK